MSEIVQLPQGWSKASLQDVAVWSSGGTPSRKVPDYFKGNIPWLKTGELGDRIVCDAEEFITEDAIRNSSAKVFPKNSVVLAMYGATIGKASILGIDAATNQACAVGITDAVTPVYLYYYLISQTQKFIDAGKGGAQPNISQQIVKAWPINVAPMNEQIRLVEKLDELFSELDAGVKELKAAQIKLIQYRQSLLRSAVEGSLTEQWREANSGSIRESGEQLLVRILTERRERWEQQKLADFQAKDKKPPKNWKEKYPEPVRPDTADLPELPAGWVWASLSQIGWLDRGKSKHRPRNAEHLYGGAYPFVQTGEIRSADQYIRHTEKTYSEEGLKQSKLWPKGTMCITIAANIGETAILDIEACFPDSIVGFSTIIEDMPIEYVEYVFRILKHKLNDEAPATAQKNINLEILYKEVIPLPPVVEQLTIVEYLNTKLENIKHQKKATALGLKQSEAQRKNILKSAFSGQLVPLDPNDEPASVLLEKIKAEREALAKIPKPRTPRKPKKKVDVMDTLLEVLTAEDGWVDAQEAFKKCGIVDETSTDRIEEIYTELRKLEKAGKIEIERNGGYDQLKLITQEVKED
ncbi:restriction endonuclease subunit S [Photobacterium indicum]|uniref:Restriction endonuclease subunit S n=1 Tax=Photobacterium indicum TaxID=81447 RepID=A0A2T3L5A4_9GAMM|nr:restriction endonuclease subunit S [Photobacterium indicum]PSV44880.1 restriction endonuclease subunit S [Photobacterium indicum]